MDQPQQSVQPDYPSTTPTLSEISESPNRKFSGKKILLVAGSVVLVIAATAGGYLIGSQKSSKSGSAQSARNAPTITLPIDATVTAECVEGRGKQYILPKDIPDGPIYDVLGGKVIGIEYLVGIQEVSTMPAKFKNLGLKNGQYDHISITPTNPHAGFNEQHVHVITSMVPVSVTDAIKCTSSTPSTEHPNSNM